MNIVKKITSIILSSIMVLLCITPTYAYEEQTNNYEYLLSLGYPAEFLDSLTESSMQKMLDMIGNNYISDIEVQKSTLNKNDAQTFGTINESYLTFHSAVGYVCQVNTNKISSILVTVTWEWVKNKPLYCGKDAVTFNWDNTIFSYDAGTFYAQDYYKSNVTDEWTIFHEYSQLAASNQGGIGHWTDLKAFKNYVGGCMVFLLNPNAPMIKGSNYNTTLNAEYAHAPVPLTGLSFSLVGFGIGLNWNLTCDTLSDPSNFKFSR